MVNQNNLHMHQGKELREYLLFNIPLMEMT